MFILIPITLFGWLGVVFFLFKHLPPQRALVISFITAYLFLPVYAYLIPGLPAYGKMTATCYAVCASAILLDWYYVKTFRPSWIDIPMLVWCTCPFITSLDNGLGAYDGFRAASEQCAYWGVPYFFGRLYLGNLTGLRTLAVGIVAGGFVYAPLCLFEFRMSPQLHLWIYGIPVNDYAFQQSIRKGGYRPFVFNLHGLSVALWMSIATIIGIWLWQSGTLKTIWNISIKKIVSFLLFVVIIIQSTGAWLYLLLSIAVMVIARFLKTSVLMTLLMGLVCTYLYTATTGSFNGDQITNFFSTAVNPDRAESLQFRLDQEKALVTKARKRIVFGWGGWGRARVFNEYGKDVSVTDSFWVIVFGTNGLMGIASITTVMFLPIVLFIYYFPAKTWFHPKIAPAAAISMSLICFMTDNLVNNMGNTVYVLALGSLSGLIATEIEPEYMGKGGISVQTAEQLLPPTNRLQPQYLESNHSFSRK
ncbi:O-antigen ligase family protein [Alkalinema pantanalense CENA528]|uniref:O-antigen ligase family protein n=1 Tax=Alkalinema pantanalense TaxID=1620705 RepID=UPI003D6F93A0